jgi:hypothetical protein
MRLRIHSDGRKPKATGVIDRIARPIDLSSAARREGGRQGLLHCRQNSTLSALGVSTTQDEPDP